MTCLCRSQIEFHEQVSVGVVIVTRNFKEAVLFKETKGGAWVSNRVKSDGTRVRILQRDTLRGLDSETTRGFEVNVWINIWTCGVGGCIRLSFQEAKTEIPDREVTGCCIHVLR